MVQSPFGPADSTTVHDPRETAVRFYGDQAEPYRFRCQDGYVLVMNFRIEDEPKLAWVSPRRERGGRRIPSISQ
jgi:hypothetical protein